MHGSTPPWFDIRLRSVDELTSILFLDGELDSLTAAVLVGTADAVPGDRRLEIDASELTFCGVAGVRALVAIASSRCQGPVVVHDARGTVRRLLDLIKPANEYVRVERTPVAAHRD
jgi:anti-anti-sigma regulatory factor